MEIKATFQQASYIITIKEHLWQKIALQKKTFYRSVLLTDTTLYALYEEKIISIFSQEEIITIAPGEKSKNSKTKEEIEKKLFEKQFPKDGALFLLGGGSLLDLGGFIASTYMRGISFISIPSTLLAMVDASIGGKTAMNTKWGKNLIGTIYHPYAIFIDIALLHTLNQSQLLDGYSEIIKAALIRDKKFFYWIKDHRENKEELIRRAIEIKLSITEKDERESSFRKLLNFGHTIGHAIESLSQYLLSHGKAVAIGMLVETEISYQVGLLPEEEKEIIVSLLQALSLLYPMPSPFDEEKFFFYLMQDKKRAKGKVEMVLLAGIGKAVLSSEKKIHIDRATIEKALGVAKSLCLQV